ncbi:phytanoyl-CoA dioxygenase family protein [Thermomonas carbonis]|uniref:Phytanoyl-CoA dioxygenase family protein n=1 Tax=Thermomonas carbonis TaxID=1463158 RepID=A0A7G9SMQ1_9GAMM|nr:phytanoyl-CoA dioxygenase family protein [Thermomonas carbonis]QNN69126.1 phytanoyl-CoA dioxygenase family protein [Thermomonas carbonis]
MADADAERSLTRDGYVVLRLLSAVAVQRLLDELSGWVPDFPDGFYASVHAPDAGLRATVSAHLLATFRPLLASACREERLLGGAFINKAPGPRGALPPHQDWNIVDERHHRSFNVWVPLVGTHAENGAIQVLPGSHRWLPTVRGPNIPCVYRELHEELRALMTILPMLPGDVLIYDHRLLHCSAANLGAAPRPGAVMGLVPAEAELKHYFAEGDQVRRYHSDVQFLLSGQTHLPPARLCPEVLFDHDTTALGGEQLKRIRAASCAPPHHDPRAQDQMNRRKERAP